MFTIVICDGEKEKNVKCSIVIIFCKKNGDNVMMMMVW